MAAHGAPGGPAVPPAPLPAVTRVARTGVGVGAGQRDELSLPRDSPVIGSLCFVSFDLQGAGAATVEECALEAVTLASFSPPSSAAQRNIWQSGAMLRHGLSANAISAALHACNLAGIFANQYYQIEAFARAVAEAKADGKVPTAQAAALELSAPMVQEGESFDRLARGGGRGHPAVAAANGPADLAFLDHLSWGDVLRAALTVDADLPQIAVARFHVMLGSRSSFAMRDDVASDVRVVADELRGRVIEWGALRPTPGNPLLARKTADFIVNALLMMPEKLRGGGGSPVDMQPDLQDGVTIISDKGAAASSCVWRRVYVHLDRFILLSKFKPVVTSATALALHLDRLIIHFVRKSPGEGTAALLSCLADLEHRLAPNAAEIDDLVAAAYADMNTVVTALIECHRDLGADGPVHGGAGAAGGDDDDGDFGISTGGPLTVSAIAAALATNTFRDAVTEAEDQHGSERLATW